MSGGVYLIQEDGGLVEMAEQEYATEDLLQELLAKHPNLLAGDQMSSGEQRRWLLISREMGVPAEEEGGDQWSIDHLFLDQDAIPTIVEVKRSTDTRIRREVVGQMLDYAANAVVYWQVDRLRIRFEEGHEDPEQELMNLLNSPDADMDDFWQKVKTNLQAGRVRLVFVAEDTYQITPDHRVLESADGPGRGTGSRDQTVRRRKYEDARASHHRADSGSAGEKDWRDTAPI